MSEVPDEDLALPPWWQIVLGGAAFAAFVFGFIWVSFIFALAVGP